MCLCAEVTVHIYRKINIILTCGSTMNNGFTWIVYVLYKVPVNVMQNCVPCSSYNVYKYIYRIYIKRQRKKNKIKLR